MVWALFGGIALTTIVNLFDPLHIASIHNQELPNDERSLLLQRATFLMLNTLLGGALMGGSAKMIINSLKK